MAEETSTRTALRRKICKELRMPFFRRVAPSGSSLVGATSTVSTVVDAKLAQPDGTWNNAWYYNVTAGEISLIRSFRADTDTLFLEQPSASTGTVVGNTYEIHSVWNADEIHDAINEAIRYGRRTFPETVTDETLVIQEEVLTYTISGLSKIPWIISKLWVENKLNCERGNVVSAASTSVTLPSIPSGVTSTWRITIYAGTGAGQIRSAAVPTGNTFAVTAWTTIPDTTSKYALFDASEELTSWIPYNDFHTDVQEFPDSIYLNTLNAALYGMRLRIEMLAVSPELSTESATTNIPAEYIKAKACSILHGQALSNTRADKDTHYAEYKRYLDEADAYVVRNAPHTPGIRFKTPLDRTTLSYTNDPLGWNGGM